MRAVDKFQRFGRKIYNSQDVLKNQILQKFPIHYTNDTDDLSQVEQYADKSDYVWLVDSSIDVYRSFPFSLKFPSLSNISLVSILARLSFMFIMFKSQTISL